MSDTTSVTVLYTVPVEKAVTVAVKFLDPVEQGRQVEFMVGLGQPLVPVPRLYVGRPVPWLYVGRPVRVLL